MDVFSWFLRKWVISPRDWLIQPHKSPHRFSEISEGDRADVAWRHSKRDDFKEYFCRFLVLLCANNVWYMVMCREPVFHGLSWTYDVEDLRDFVCERNQCAWMRRVFLANGLCFLANCNSLSWIVPQAGGTAQPPEGTEAMMTLGLQRFLIWWHMHLVTRCIMQIYRSLWSLGSGRVQLEAGVPGRNSHGCLRGEGDCQVAVRERQGGMGKGVFLLGVDSQDMPRCLRQALTMRNLGVFETFPGLLSVVFVGLPWQLVGLWPIKVLYFVWLSFGTDFLYILPSEGEPHE